MSELTSKELARIAEEGSFTKHSVAAVRWAYAEIERLRLIVGDIGKSLDNRNAQVEALKATHEPLAESDKAGDWYLADDIDRLVRELDCWINGESGAAKQAKLCDVVAQIRHMTPRHDPGPMTCLRCGGEASAQPPPVGYWKCPCCQSQYTVDRIVCPVSGDNRPATAFPTRDWTQEEIDDDQFRDERSTQPPPVRHDFREEAIETISDAISDQLGRDDEVLAGVILEALVEENMIVGGPYSAATKRSDDHG